MSGKVRGKIECLINIGALGGRNFATQAVFKNIYDFFASHPNYTIVSLQYGAGGPGTVASGNGTGYAFQTGSFAYNAFFVARANATTTRPYDVYHLFQWTGASSLGAPALAALTSSAPALAINTANFGGTGNTVLIHACAIGVGGTSGSIGGMTGSLLSPNNGNPWKGSTNANGRDFKGSGAGTTAVWGAPLGGGTGVIIFPRSNDGSTGAHRTLTQNMSNVYTLSSDTGQLRMHIVGDDDSWALAIDTSDNGAYTLSYSGLYTPRDGITVQYPYCNIVSYNALPWSVTDQSTYGDVAGTSTQQGGIVTPLSGTCAQLQMDHYNNFCGDTNFWPDRATSTPVYNEFDIPLGIFEAIPSQISCFLGQLDFIREMYNVQTNYVTKNFSRIILGSATLTDRKYTMPWDNVTNTVPRSGTTIQGITFVQS